jgi:Protein of unknown function (DUF998)
VVVAAGLALACAGGCAACLVYLDVASTGYSPVRNAVSEYRAGRYGPWYAIQATLAGVSAACLAIALRHPRQVVILLSILAIARIAIGWLRVDVRPGRPTRRGAIHALLGLVAFITASWAAIALQQSDHGEPLLGWLLAALALLTIISLRTPLRPWFGLSERGYYAATLAWLMVTSARLV